MKGCGSKPLILSWDYNEILNSQLIKDIAVLCKWHGCYMMNLWVIWIVKKRDKQYCVFLIWLSDHLHFIQSSDFLHQFEYHKEATIAKMATSPIFPPFLKWLHYEMYFITYKIAAFQMLCCVLEGQIINGSSLVAKWQEKFMITDLPHHYHKVLSKISS